MALLTREMIPLQAEERLNESPFGDTQRHELIPIHDGVAGIADTLNLMVSFTRQFRRNLRIRSLAEQIVSIIPSRNYWGEAQAIQNWVRTNIRYTQDVADVETLKTPEALLFDRLGDCDDMATLTGALLQSIGHPVRYVAVGSGEANEFNHVYLETKIGDRWVAVETTENEALGWQPETQFPRMVRNV